MYLEFWNYDWIMLLSKSLEANWREKWELCCCGLLRSD